MEPLMNPERLGARNPAQAGFEADVVEYLEMGFVPAWLDFGTQTLHPTCSSPALVPGFQRNGFFYTRTHAARSVADWRKSLV